MNESGVTAWECRDIARRIKLDGLYKAFTITNYRDVIVFRTDPLAAAMVSEALNLLADKKEAERKAT